MYEFCITCARILWNVDKDVFDLLIYPGICWSVSTSTCLYVFFFSGFALSLLSCGSERSEAERGGSQLHFFQLWEQVWPSRMRLFLITCWKV